MSEEGPYCLDDIKKIARYIKSNIIVVDRQSLNKVVYKTFLPYENKIYLLLDNQHYNLITSITAYLGAPYYCEKCDSSYNNKDAHICNNINTNNNNQEKPKKDYNRERRLRGWTYNKNTHKKECNNCGHEVMDNKNNHEYFFQKIKFKESSEKYIIGDFETRINEENGHIVNYGVFSYYPKKGEDGKYEKPKKYIFQ